MGRESSSASLLALSCLSLARSFHKQSPRIQRNLLVATGHFHIDGQYALPE